MKNLSVEKSNDFVKRGDFKFFTVLLQLDIDTAVKCPEAENFSFLASISLETMDFLYFVRSSVTKILSLLFFNSFLALKTLFFAIHVLTYR